MRDFKVEDTVILLDVSRSMLKTDFPPNRLKNAIETIKNFIRTKFSIDLNDKIALITFGKHAKKLSPFTNEEEKLYRALQRIRISGKGNLIQGISFSLQLLIEEMRKLGGKVSRIFVVTDNKFTLNKNKFNDITEVAKGLGVLIDACQIGNTEASGKNELKILTRQTGGEYGYFNNSKALINAGIAFASKKNIKPTRDYITGNTKEKSIPLINEIALPLKRPSVLELKIMLNKHKTAAEKCQICHSSKSPITNADLFSEGRACPSCEHLMHLSCAAMWAKGTEYDINIFRCPFCFYLLKIPKSALKIAELKLEKSKKDKRTPLKTHETTKMKLIPKAEVASINYSCSYCHNIFLGEYEVFQCEKCGSYYHEPCLRKMYEEIKSCRFCGAEIV
ncbi:MAG: VWA domain-containing protein [Promethearchaeota archaeon]